MNTEHEPSLYELGLEATGWTREDHIRARARMMMHDRFASEEMRIFAADVAEHLDKCKKQREHPFLHWLGLV